MEFKQLKVGIKLVMAYCNLKLNIVFKDLRSNTSITEIQFLFKCLYDVSRQSDFINRVRNGLHNVDASYSNYQVIIVVRAHQ